MEVKVVPAHGGDADLALTLGAGHVHRAEAAPGIAEKLGIGADVQGRLMELVHHGLAEGVDLLQAQLFVHGHEAAELAKLRLALPLPALRLMLAVQQLGQVAVKQQAKHAEQSQSRRRKGQGIAFQPCFHPLLSAMRTWSPLFTGELLVVIT